MNERTKECLRPKLTIIDARHLEIFREGSKLQKDEAVQYLKEVGLYLNHVEIVEFYLEMRAD